MTDLNRLLLVTGVLICYTLSPALATTVPKCQTKLSGDTTRVRPDHVNNAESSYFPSVFNQDGGSCGSASRIGYMFTHEINAFRGADASKQENIYPTHFTWLLTNSHSGKEGMAMANGVPNSLVYGGTTYSKVFGNQDCASPDFGWMQGYDKWYSAMFNRISHNSFSPLGVDTEKGREFVKNWLWNHQGDDDFHIGGICGIGVASACKQASIADDPEGKNAAAGVVGQKYVTRWGDGVDHALTIVGYDDRIVFDLDSNKVYGEKDKDECGAWIIVNSWGDGWANKGFIYCPYKYGFPVRQHEGGAWKPEFYHVRKNYRPFRTLKVRMDYSHRSELKLLVGISADLEADEPDISVELEHFKFAGDGRSDKAKQGKEAATPMLGKWADGKLHDEPMEFGYDLTDLSSGFDTRRPLKYFFIIESRKESVGTGYVYDCSVIDYEFDRSGIETPFETDGNIKIRNNGERTIITTCVYGEPFFAPLNLRCTNDGVLLWDRPQISCYPLRGYVVFKDGCAVDTVSNALRYPCKEMEASYSLAALYQFTDTVSVLSARTPSVCPDFLRPVVTRNLALQQSGFTISDIFNNRCKQATIEYWLKPESWRDWNQSIGPGWGKFLAHANDDGSLSVGWDTDDRINTRKGLVTPGQWHHFAYVIAQDTLTAYVNGVPVDTLVSRTHSGIGGFKEFPFASGETGAIDGELAEVRIWKEARTQKQIQEMMHRSFGRMGIPKTLMAYYKGMIIERDHIKMWRDFANDYHARLSDFGRYQESEQVAWKKNPVSETTFVDFSIPQENIYAGQAFTLSPVCSPSISSLRWSASKAQIKELEVKNPTFVFSKPGKKRIVLKGRTADGKKVKASHKITVLRPDFNAAFRPAKAKIAVGERISFHPLQPLAGYRYEWTFPRADTEKAYTQGAATTYSTAGEYEARLLVSNPSTGESVTETRKIQVKNVVPLVQFEVSPMVIRKGSSVTLTDRSRYMPTGWEWKVDSRKFTRFAHGNKTDIRMDVPGVYDVTLTARNEVGSSEATQRNVLIVCNADSKNGLNFSNPQATLTTAQPLWEGETTAMTIDWWMHPASKGEFAGMGHAAGTWQMTANSRGRLTLFADSLSVHSDDGFIIPGQWHHYAVTFQTGEVKFLRDGEVCKTTRLKNKSRTVTRVPAFPSLRIGGKTTPMNAVIDEFRIWKKALADTTIQRYCNAPIEKIAEAESSDSLMLYYSFNQSGGDVQDLTSHKNTGKRESFGPDGDAWGRSTGVFCLNFDTPFVDISSAVLPDSSRPFVTTEEFINQKDTTRFLAFDTNKGWKVENAIVTDSVTTGVYIDKKQANALCVYTGRDGFSNELSNHKLYCTVVLPAGKYELEVIPCQRFSSGSSRLVAAYGKGLPDIEDMDSAFASAFLSERRLAFVLLQETELSLGMVFNLQGNAGISIDRIVLHKGSTTQ